MGTAPTPTTATLRALAEAAATGQTVTVVFDAAPVTGTVYYNPFDPDTFQVQEVGTRWVSPSFYPDAVTEVIWE